MSNKKIQKRLREIFSDIQNPDSTTQKNAPATQEPLADEAGSSSISIKPKQESSHDSLNIDQTSTLTMPAEGGLVTNTESMAIPFRLGPESWAAIEIPNPEDGRSWNQNEQMLAKQVIDQLALALENARLFQQTQRQATELQVLNEMGRDLAAQLDISGIVETLYRYLGRLMDVTNLVITLFSSEMNNLEAALAVIDNKRVILGARPLGNEIIDHIIRTHEPLLLSDNVIDYLQKYKLDNTFIDSKKRTPKCWIGTPILLGDTVLGVVSLYNFDDSDIFDSHNLELLVSFANQAAIAIQNSRLFQQTQIRAEELGVLNEMGRTLTSTVDLDEIVGAIHEFTSRLVDTSGFYIALYDEDQDIVTFPIAYEHGELTKIATRTTGNGLTEYVLRNGEPLLLEDSSAEKIRFLGIDFIGSASRCWMGLPMMIGSKPIGVIGIENYENPYAFNLHTRNLMTSIASQAAIAIQNARLFNETVKRNAELTTINDIISSANETLELKAILQNVLIQIMGVAGFDAGLITIYNEDRGALEKIVQIGMPYEIPTDPADGLENTLCSVVYKLKEILIVEDLEKSAPVDVMEEINAGFLSYAGIPLESKGIILGTLCGFRKMAGSFNKDTVTLLRSVGRQVGFSIENARLFQQAEIRAEELAALNDLGRKLTSTLSLDEILHEVFIGVSRLVDTTNFYIALHDPVKDENYFPLNVTESVVDKEITHLPAGQGITGYIVRTREAVLIRNNVNDWLEQKGMKRVGEAALSWLGVPILLGDQIIGVLAVQNYKEPNAYDDHDQAMLSAIANQTAIAIQNARLFDEVKKSSEELSIINRAIASAATTLNLSDAFTLAMKEISNYVPGISTASLASLDEEKKNLIIDAQHSASHAVKNTLNQKISLFDNRIFTQVVETRKKIGYNILGDSFLSFELNKEYLQNGIKSILIFPILSASTILGLIILELTDVVESVPPEKIRIVETIITQTSTALQNARLFDQISSSEARFRRNNEYLAVSAEIGRLVTSTLDIKTLFLRTVNLIKDRFGFYYASIFTVDDTGFNAILREATGSAGDEMKRRSHSLPVGSRSVVGTATSTGKPTVVNDVSKNPIHRPNPLLPDTRAETAIPLRIGDRIIGAIDIQSTQTGSFTDDDIQILQSLADQVAVAIDNARSYELSQEAIKEMRELDRLKDQFLANMSHELRTPLNSIIGFSRVILKGIDGPVSELQEQDLSAIYNSGQHLLRLINDILDLSKIEAGKMELAFDDVNIEETINSVLPTVSGLIKDKPIKIVKEIDNHLPTIRADSMRLRQVLINLLSNATKFTEEGTITVGATIEKNAQGQDHVVVRVTDTGTGIAPEDMGKLFQAFSQVDASPTRKTGGTGLGLSISRHLVEMHGGELDVISEFGKGSTFFFTLPTPQQNADSTESGYAQITNNIVLSIDDDIKILNLYERFLRSQGYQVVGLTDPSQAKERARQLKPFAITLDVMMPGQDGWSVLRDLKSDPGTRNIPVIICTILEENDKGFSLGATDYLVKPIIQEDLLHALSFLGNNEIDREILIIDDDPADIRLIEKIITEDPKYKIIKAVGGVQGWEILENMVPDAIILDLFMPDMNGFHILEKLKTTPRLINVPVIILSGADLTIGQQQQLLDYGKNMIKKGAVTNQDLLVVLENELKRISTGRGRTP